MSVPSQTQHSFANVCQQVDSAARAKLQISAERETAALNRLFDMASKSNQDVEPDNAYTCRLTMEVQSSFTCIRLIPDARDVLETSSKLGHGTTILCKTLS